MYALTYYRNSTSCEGTFRDTSNRLLGCDIQYDDYEYEENDYFYYYDDYSDRYQYHYFGDDSYYFEDDDDYGTSYMQFCADNMPTEASSTSSSSDTLSSGATIGIAIAGTIVGRPQSTAVPVQ
jgi:hypothetical protein